MTYLLDQNLNGLLTSGRKLELGYFTPIENEPVLFVIALYNKFKFLVPPSPKIYMLSFSSHDDNKFHSVLFCSSCSICYILYIF